jgi:hypothetical protein
MPRLKCIYTLYLCPCAALPLAAQNANVSGIVDDAPKASISGSMVTLRNIDTGSEVRTTVGEGPPPGPL